MAQLAKARDEMANITSDTHEPTSQPISEQGSTPSPSQGGVDTPTTQPTSEQGCSPSPTEGGWYLAERDTSCTDACTSQSMMCSEQAMFDHNNEVDSSSELRNIIMKGFTVIFLATTLPPW